MSEQRPTIVYIITRDGERVDCLLEILEPMRWQATPVRNVAASELEGFFVDVLPPGGTVELAILDEDPS